MTTKEQCEFEGMKRAVEAVRKRVGIESRYERHDWNRDQQAIRESVRRKQALRKQQAARIAGFEAWHHGELSRYCSLDLDLAYASTEIIDRFVSSSLFRIELRRIKTLDLLQPFGCEPPHDLVY